MKLYRLAALLPFLLAGCAKSVSSIMPEYVSPGVFQAMTCDQIFEEQRRLSSEVARVSGRQQNARNTDAALVTVGAIVFWPALIGLAFTEDQSAELGRLKGEYEAVQQAAKIKGCST